MPSKMQGILTVAANTTEQKQTVYVHWMTIQLSAQTNFHGHLRMTVKKKRAISPVLAVSFKKFFYGQI